ncbi:YicC/YloC family endoribonuclease [Haliovirga abyssi]|uniref:YicC family protein n=1 Tax=Haliovirga abyssi TaxID=2996794 RepID=A0AAU9DXR7_9FUSO|nr:YicC/YloC family endoribonuclease [Haliovirga abyssi]BDU51286.1 hypothetical protein HLVA_18550 [Haliovirga abyssi]
MKSMTGYSKVSFENEDFKIKIELKSVNNKYLNLKYKSNYILNFLENKIRTKVSEFIKRGYVELRIDFEDKRESEELFEYKENIAKSYMKLLEKIELEFSEKFINKAELLIKYPNIIKKKELNIDEKEYENFIIPRLEEALLKLNEMREFEGEKLKEYLIERIEILSKSVIKIDDYKELVVKEHKKRLLDRLEKINSDIKYNEEDILKEILLFADRSDISEEVSRLNSHLEQLNVEIEKNSNGKKLDFLIQEIFRELNTAGVKSNYYDISKLVVESKAELEKIREQVQNIE